MNQDLRAELQELALKYETADFIKNDPSCFMHRYSDTADAEVAAFIAASLSFGRREQILLHADSIMHQAQGSPAGWIRDGGYMAMFPESERSFYRMFSFRTMRLLCDGMREILKKENTLGQYFNSVYSKNRNSAKHLSVLIADEFAPECTIIPHGKSSANKRLNMFLRWMVRDNSPVDLGLWTWFKKSDLLIPMDTHVIHTAVQFRLLQKTPSGNLPAATMKNAVSLTHALEEAFPGDPVKGDFALFGLGIDS